MLDNCCYPFVDHIVGLMIHLVLLPHINTMFGKMIAAVLEQHQDSPKENVRIWLVSYTILHTESSQKVMKLCMLCSMLQLSVWIKCKIIFGLSTDCHLQYIRDRLPERQLAQSQSPVGKVRVFYDGLYCGSLGLGWQQLLVNNNCNKKLWSHSTQLKMYMPSMCF